MSIQGVYVNGYRGRKEKGDEVKWGPWKERGRERIMGEWGGAAT